MSRNFLWYLVILIIAVVSCKQVYYPELDVTTSPLVVVGMVTDEPGIYTVKLSRAMSFNSTSYTPEQGAIVHVEDSEGDHYIFAETFPGNYASDPNEFLSKYNDSYTLVVQTKDGKTYRSSPQKLNSKGSLDSLYSSITSSTLTTYYGETTQLSHVKGAEFLADIDLKSDPSPYYRFSNTLLVESISNLKYFDADSISLTSYCWKKYIPYEYLNLSDWHNTAGKIQQRLGFCPIDTNFFGINKIPVYKFVKGEGMIQNGWIFQTLQLYSITFKQYHLNTDIFDYYKAVNTQLSAKQQIMDPLTVQCIGNITCITKPNEPVLGIFEASSVNIYSYIYTGERLGSLMDFKRISPVDFEKFPGSDCQSNTPPYFWMYLINYE